MDERMFEFMQETTRALGRIEEGVKNNSEHTMAVSRKADKIEVKLDNHIGNTTDAHGKGAEEKASKNIMGWLGWAVAVGGFLLAVVKWSHG